MGAHGLFDAAAPRVVTIPAAMSFLDVLAGAVVDAVGYDGSPFGLADALILLPTRRAAQGLMEAFAARLGGAALLPTMRPLADLEDDPDVWGAEPMAFGLPPSLAPMQRRMELAALIRARDTASGGVDEPVRALAFADELCALLDGAAAAGEADWSKLPDLVTDEHLAGHWRQSAQFLEIIASYWPQRLASAGLMDPGERRSAVLRALAAHWQTHPPETPVIIAGSTGSLPATRALMRVVAGLPKGAVVLPGLDAGLDDKAWDAIGPQHPQATLRDTLVALGIHRRDVVAIGPQSDESGRCRAVLLREALAPADATADWLRRVEAAGGADVLAQGAAGLALIEAETETEEASVIALALTSAVQRAGASAALVTPSAALARRVAAKLARFGEKPAVSLGRPLSDTPVGALLTALVALADDGGDPVALLSVLKHPDVACADEQAVAALEHRHLRGARRFRSLAALRATAEGECVLGPVADAMAMLDRILAAAEVSLDQVAEGLCAAAESLGGEALWSGADGAAGADLLRSLIETGEALGPMRGVQALRTLRRLIERVEAPPSPIGDARITILGPLEARLQRRDLIVLGGLNEGVWPEAPAEGSFLSRRMRTIVGLASPDQRVGLSAHDFAQLACAPHVLMTRAKREGGAPVVASRWVWRLQTLMRGANGDGLLAAPRDRPYAAWAAALDRPGAVRPCRAPAPRLAGPQALMRLSVTDAETLFRDPYAIYAKRVLGLVALRGVGEAAGAAERGSAIHNAIETFETLPVTEQMTERLAALLQEGLMEAGFRIGQIAADGARLADAARAYCVWSAAQRDAGARTVLERRGKLVLARSGVTLSGRADRIDLFADGSAHIVDVKTGKPPTLEQLRKDFSPQLLLEAAMLAVGGFEGVPRAQARQLVYWRFSGSDPTAEDVSLEAVSLGDAASEAVLALEDLLARYREAGRPFLSKPRAFFAKAWGDYDQLARRKEWSMEGDE